MKTEEISQKKKKNGKSIREVPKKHITESEARSRNQRKQDCLLRQHTRRCWVISMKTGTAERETHTHRGERQREEVVRPLGAPTRLSGGSSGM